MTKVKMDKVRRLLGNRYGEESRDAVLTFLSTAVADFDPTTMAQADVEKAKKAISDLVSRASKEPVEVEVEEEE